MKSETVKQNKTIPLLNFRAHPQGIRAHLEEKGCFSKSNKAVYRELLDFTDLNETTRIHDDLYPYSGITFHISRQRLADESGYSLRKVTYALKELCEAKAIKKLDKHPETGCYRYKLTIYDDAIAYLKANPDHPRCQISTLAVSPEQIDALTKSAMNLLDRVETLKPPKTDQDEGGQALQGEGAVNAPKKDCKERKNGSLPSIPRDDSSRGQEDGKNPERNSQKDKDVQHGVFTSASVELTQEFHRIFGSGFPTQRQIKTHSDPCIELLNELYDEPALKDAFPDPDSRADACVKVLAKAFQKLPISKSDPPRSPAYFKAHSGQDAISKAIPAVIRAEWSDEPDEPEPQPLTESEIEAHCALEMDPPVQEMYETMYGPNWREKREREIRGGWEENAHNPSG